MGALAAAMSETDKIGYIADYPIYGMVANINAFALGAAMINPRAKIYLNWVGLADSEEEIKWDEDIHIISGVDMIVPERASREYGLYNRTADGKIENLAVAALPAATGTEHLAAFISADKHKLIRLRNHKRLAVHFFVFHYKVAVNALRNRMRRVYHPNKLLVAVTAPA